MTENPVGQADRDAAELFMNSVGWLCEEDWSLLHPGDQDAVARAFARHRLTAQPELAGVGEAVDVVAQGFWLDLCEKSDRTSPEEYPDMCLIEQDELRDMLRYVAALSAQPEPAKDEAVELREALRAWLSYDETDWSDDTGGMIASYEEALAKTRAALSPLEKG